MLVFKAQHRVRNPCSMFAWLSLFCRVASFLGEGATILELRIYSIVATHAFLEADANQRLYGRSFRLSVDWPRPLPCAFIASIQALKAHHQGSTTNPAKLSGSSPVPSSTKFTSTLQARQQSCSTQKAGWCF